VKKMSNLLGLIGDYGSDEEDDDNHQEEERTQLEASAEVGMEIQDQMMMSEQSFPKQSQHSKYPFLENLPPPSTRPVDPQLLLLLQQRKQNPNQQYDLIEVRN
jgi:hypothetical protein